MSQSFRRRVIARPFAVLTQSIAVLAAASALNNSTTHAADIYWDGITGGWEVVGNWSTDPTAVIPDPAAVPGVGDLAIFNVSSVNAAETISLNAARSVLGVVFNNTGTTALQGGGTNRTLTLGASGIQLGATAGAVTIGSGTSGQNVTVALGAAQSWTNNSAALLTVTNNVTLGANLLTVTGTGGATFSGIVSGTGGITKTGNGTLTMTGANTYTGATSVNAGIVRATAAGSLGAGALTLGGGTVELGNSTGTAFNRNTTVTANSTIVSDRAVAGAGVTHTLGTLSIGAQTLNVTRGALATSGTGAVSFGATTLTGAAVFAPAANAQLNLTGVVSGGFGFTKSGAGILALSGANTFTGEASVAQGTLRITNADALGTNPNINLLGAAGNPGSTLDLSGSITFGAGKTVTLNSNTTGDLRSTLTGSSGNSVWVGNIVAVGSGLTQVSAASGATLSINGPVTSSDAGTLFTRGTGTVIYNGILTLGPRTFNHTESGNVIVNSTGNTWSASQVSDGQIQLGATNALPAVDFTLGQNSATNGRFELNGFNQTVAGLRTFSTSSGTNHIIRNSNLTTASTLTVTNTATDVLKNTTIQRVGVLNLVKAGVGRLELQDVRVENSSLAANEGTLAFTGVGSVNVLPNITGLAGGTIDKAGTGTVTLLGTYNHPGATTVTAGTLNIGGGTAGSISVADGATLGSGVGGGSLTSGALTFGTVGATTFAPNLTTPGGAPIVSASSLTANGTGVAVTPIGANIAPGTYPLIAYGGGAITGGFSAFTLGAQGTFPHMVASLVDNSAQGRVDLNVTSVDSLVWTGATGVWDINTTSNFKLASDSSAANFFQGDRVLFDDTATTKAITITGAPIIGNLTFNNSTGNDYTITGPLAGPGGVTKNNTGSVTLGGANSFSGPISVTGGTLVLGATTAVTNVTGDVSVAGGTLKLGNTDALSSAASITISAGGTFDVNGLAPNIKIPHIHVSGTGVGGNGAIVNSGAGFNNNNHALVITLDGDTTWGGTGRYDVGTATLFNGGNFTLTKKGAAEFVYQPAAGSTVGNVVVDAGTFTLQSTNALATTSTVTVNSGATHQFFGNFTHQHPVILNDGSILRSSSSTPTVNGTITLNGANANRNIQATSGNTLNVAGKITGAGGFTVNDAGTVQIRNAGNDYAGNTVISNGTLNFDAVGSLPTTTNLIVNGGTFDPVNRTHFVSSLDGTGGQINQGTAGTGVLVSTQSTVTTYSGNINRVTVRMDGTGTLTLGGTTDNSGGFAIVNSGTLVLAKTGDYGVHTVGSGNLGLTINGGTLQLGGSLTAFTGGSTSNNPPADITVGAPPANYVDQIFNLTEVLLNTGGTFDLNGRMEAIDGLAGGGLITNTSATAGRLYVGFNNTTSTAPGFTGNTSEFSGAVTDGAGTVELRKIGTGTLILSGNSTHTGGTFITAGTLVVNGGLSGGLLTVNGGTLAGIGDTGAVTLTSGTIAPSAVVDPLNTGILSLGGGTVAMDITGATASDQISVVGAVNFSANVALTLNFSSYDPVDNVDTFTLILNDGADSVGMGGGFTFAGNPLPEGAIFTATSGSFNQAFQITYAGGSGNDVVLAAVPEPASATLLLGGLASVMGLRRTRRRM